MKESEKGFDPLLAEQLREQVGNLMAAVQLLTPAVLEQEDRKYDQYLAIMNQSLYCLLRLTEHVDFMSRGGGNAHTRQVDLSLFCRELCGEVIPLAERAGVAFSCEQAGSGPVVEGDPVLLQRMLLNLINNALRAAGRGGRAGLRLTAEGKRARIVIWDSGAGDTPPGARTAAGQTLEEALRMRSSLGIGVEIARTIAASHGGSLMFEQGEGGTRAVVSLPAGKYTGGTLRSPSARYDATGGFSQVLVELADVLPYEVFLPEDVE